MERDAAEAQGRPFAGEVFGVDVADQVCAPDAIYDVQRDLRELRLIKADHMREVDPKVARTAPRAVRGFVSWLGRQKRWMLTALLDAYAAIGRYQLRFLATLDPMDRLPLPVTRLPEPELHSCGIWPLTASNLFQVRRFSPVCRTSDTRFGASAVSGCSRPSPC